MLVRFGLAAARALYLFAPLLLSAGLSGVVLRFDVAPFLRQPIDCGRTFHGRRLFGRNKTWRGVVCALIGCIAGVALQREISPLIGPSLSVLTYKQICPIWVGGAMGLGAMLGELPNSFAKRQLAIEPGQPGRGRRAALFYIWDQIDLLTGAWPLLFPWIPPHAGLVAASFALALLVHPLVSLVGYVVGARGTPR